MAASTANRFDLKGVLMDVIPYEVKASEVIYQGIMVMVIPGSGTGDQLIPAADTSGGRVVGLSTQEVTGGASDGTVKCNVQPIGAPDGGRYWELDATSPTADDWIGKLCYVVDDHTVAIAGTSNTVPVGICVRVTKEATAGRVIVDTLQRA